MSMCRRRVVIGGWRPDAITLLINWSIGLWWISFGGGGEVAEGRVREGLTSTHVPIVWLVARLAGAAANGHHPLTIPIAVQLNRHIHLL